MNLVTAIAVNVLVVKNSTDRLIFLYDDLMTHEQQEIMRLPLTFLSLGLLNARLYFCNDGKRKRKFAIPNQKSSSAVIFGGIFVLDDYDDYKLHIHSFYNSSSAMLGCPHQEDLYIFSPCLVTPIKAKSYDSLLKSDIEYLNKLPCEAFIGNTSNEKIQHCMSKKYYRMGFMDTNSFKTLLKER